MTPDEESKERLSYIAEAEAKGKNLEFLIKLGNVLRERERRDPISFNDFLYSITKDPEHILRDIFQLFHDMLHHYVPEGKDDFRLSEHSIGFVKYDCGKLLVAGVDSPFFADRLFANRLMNLADGFRKGTQRNNIILFEGPPGSGKSTFLNNLLSKLEEYSKTDDGATYKVYWRLDVQKLGGFQRIRSRNRELTDQIVNLSTSDENGTSSWMALEYPQNFLEFSCPNHDHPILMVPKAYRKLFLKELISDESLRLKILNEKQYEWVVKGVPCNICSGLYNTVLDVLGEPLAVFDMIYARPNFFSRQLGECISVFSPGDLSNEKPIHNPTRQHLLNDLFNDEEIRFVYSYLAKTNNGVLALMDIKENNVKRLREYHGIISDGVHKVELGEERINTLFLGLVNPTDKNQFDDIPSFQDRIITVMVPYILDYSTEIAIYKNKFGPNVEEAFLPRVLDNFAKIVISTRVDRESPTINQWIKQPERYSKYVDKDMLLLKMALYAGQVPKWLSDQDLKDFDKPTRKAIIDETRTQGVKGLSGRQSLIAFGRLLSKHTGSGKLINMEMLRDFIETEKAFQNVEIPVGFFDALEDMYGFTVLQQVKESIFYYNKKQLSQDILDYLFAINYEPGVTRTCEYTGNTIEITEDYLKEIETVFVGQASSAAEKEIFRKATQLEFVSSTVAQEMTVEGKKITETNLYKELFSRYSRNLKEHALAPYVGNDSFRRAILDFGTKSFNAYEGKLKRDVNLLFKNLRRKFSYTVDGARQVCIYVLDNDLVKKYR